MTARAITIRENGIDRSGAEYQKWIEFILHGGLLKHVPEPFRLDEVCYYATKYSGLSDGLYTSFKRDVLPFIPVDVLFMGFLMGNVGHEIVKRENATYRENISSSKLPPGAGKKEKGKGKREGEEEEGEKKREKKE